MSRRRLLVVAHVPSANTERLRDAVVAGAGLDTTQAIDVVSLRPFDAGPDDVLAADAIVLGATA